MVSRCDFPADYYYNLHLVSGKPDEVVAISLGHGGSFSWTLVRKDGPFMFSFPAPLGGKQASGSEVDLFLHSLLEVPAKGLVPSIPNKEGRILLNI